MKRRQRRPVLELNKQGGSQEHPQNKGKQVSNDYPEQNVPANPLANLLCHYNSDSDTEDSKKDVRKLDDQVNNFLKEIQLIAPTEPVSNVSVNPALSTNPNTPVTHPLNQQMPKWQECLDESSGYPYYWHIETNEVTWEMPSELRVWKNNAKMTSVIKPPPAQESHWVDFSSITYQQSHENIPEGMIPREVVARNRNRYIRHETVEKQETPVEQDATNTSDTMDDDSDDGRIEMITSYGSEESDSDTENNYSSNETPPVTTSESTSISSGPSKVKPIEPSPAPAPVMLPQLPKNPQRSEEEYESKSTVEKSKVEVSESKFADVKDAVRSSKYQTKLSHLVDGEIRENMSVSSKSSRITKESLVSSLSEDNTSSRDAVGKQSVESDLDFRVSLVPGYDEDTDNDDEGEAKEERKALFPIPQNEDASVLHKNLPTVLNKQTLLDETRVTDSNDSDSNTDASVKNNADEQEDDGITEKVETTEESKKVEENTQKPNKFLDNFHGRSKCFQRKKRIAFEVPSAKIKIPDENEAPKTESEPQQSETNVSNDTEQQEPEPEKETQVQQQKESEEIAEDTVESVKSLAKSETSNVEAETTTQSEEQNTTKDEEEVNSLTHIVLEKLKFLSEGKPSVSPVQMMAIQLQTLFVAWEGGSLEKTYLRRWLTDTSHELERLEQEAAPPGWLCQWDRSHKRYYYQNATTGVTQWAYPDTGIAGGTEEMEICSTPPPAEQEEITTSEADGISKQSVSSKPKKSGEEDGETNENTVESHSTDIEAPPPPQISNPSPPPPPRIYAEDLKKDKRRRDKCTEKFDNKKKRLEEVAAITDIKSLENPAVPTTQTTTQTPLSPQPSVLSNIANTEPLPPGVDLPDVPYEIPATALKRIIYSTVQQQGNSLYDASTRDPRVPILGHPAALVQEHYLQYPAYHQHIHAPAALVLPHKHGVQPAIQLIPDYTPIYTNHKVIEKPPVKTAKESLVSALDSFYNDIARIEKSGPEQIAPQHNIVPPKPTVPVEETKLDTEQEPPVTDVTIKEKKRKKARIGISKKHKEMSSMVAKWQKAQQNYENNA